MTEKNNAEAKSRRQWGWSAVSVVALLAFVLIDAGCGGGGGTTPVGGISVISDFDAATRSVPGWADTLEVTVVPPAGVTLPEGLVTPFVLDRSSTALLIDGLIAVPDPYVLLMKAKTDGVIVGSAVRNVVVTKNVIREIDVSANLESAVASVHVEGVSSVRFGDSSQFTAFARNDQGATLFSGAGFTWTSSSPEVLSVDQQTGLVTGLTLGETIVSATLTGSAVTGELDVLVYVELAFHSNRDGDQDIYVMRSDGSGIVNITNNSLDDRQPAYSGDGSRIAFASGRENNWDVYVMNSDGSGQSRLTTHAAIDQRPAVSPDGTKIAFASFRDGDAEIYIMNSDGTGLTRLTNEPLDDYAPSFSPDGTRIVFHSARGTGQNVYTMNLDGSGLVNLTNSSAINWFANFSPDGSKIVFESNRNGHLDIYTMNSDGSGLTRLTSLDSTDELPAYSPDGTKIVFNTNRAGDNEIYIMNVDGSNQIRLTTNGAIDESPTMPSR